MKQKCFRLGCYAGIAIGILGILSFLLLAVWVPEEPIGRWIPALIAAVLCLISGTWNLSGSHDKIQSRQAKPCAPSQADRLGLSETEDHT